MNGEHTKSVEVRSEDQMTGSPLKHPRPYVFVLLNAVKHLHVGESPNVGDATACGIKIEKLPQWAQRASALPAMKYCRECERIVRDAT